ncbi:MAG TPA: hypothetical protein VMX14_13340 [Anaerolineae bacterium]|nr:hypothetical protein [Anaerolineae bacterium]
MKRIDRLNPTGSIVKRKLETATDANDSIHADVETIRLAQDDNALTPIMVYSAVASIEGALIEQLRALQELKDILVKKQ